MPKKEHRKKGHDGEHKRKEHGGGGERKRKEHDRAGERKRKDHGGGNPMRWLHLHAYCPPMPPAPAPMATPTLGAAPAPGGFLDCALCIALNPATAPIRCLNVCG